MANNKKYDWIDDPFKESSQQQYQGMGSGSKVFIGCGCLLALIVIVFLVVMFFSSLSSVLAT